MQAWASTALRNFGADLPHQGADSYTQASLQHAIVDDDVEAAPIYRSGGKAENQVRPHENHDCAWNEKL